MKTAVAVLYTPLHVASLVRTLPRLKEYGSIRVLHVGERCRSEKYQNYVRVLRRSQLYQGRVLELRGLRAGREWVRLFLSSVARRPCVDAFITGNPRRTPSLIAAGAASAVILIDEGLGTTANRRAELRGNYFDPLEPETSVLKRWLQSIGVLPLYATILEKVACHYTMFRSSIFPRPVFVPYEPVIPDHAVPFPVRSETLVISSLLPLRGSDHYAALLRRSVAESTDGARVWFCPHPTDDDAQIDSVMRSVPEAAVLKTPLLLEDYCMAVLSAGGRLVLRGDSNSTSALLDDLVGGMPRYVNETN